MYLCAACKNLVEDAFVIEEKPNPPDDPLNKFKKCDMCGNGCYGYYYSIVEKRTDVEP